MRNMINDIRTRELALKISREYKDFDIEKFSLATIPKLDNLGLFERLDLLTKNLKEFIPKPFGFVTSLFIKIAEPGMGFMVIALSNFVADNGMDNFDISMNTLKELTKSCSSEFGIRHFIIKDKELCFKYFREWVLDDNVEVRRLVSEGLRPRLPWGIRLQEFVLEPEPIIEFLEYLKDDKELYVRKSVANNINDIAKDHPELVIETLKSWDNKWVVKHGLRTLIKQGHPGALELLGFPTEPKVSVENITFDKKVKVGGMLNFCFDIKSLSSKEQMLVVDFVVHHQKANGSKTPKVFKLKNIKLGGGNSISINKKHSFKIITTRKYHPGEHALEIKINGKEFYFGEFELSI